jgi:hypothetical protein
MSADFMKVLSRQLGRLMGERSWEREWSSDSLEMVNGAGEPVVKFTPAKLQPRRRYRDSAEMDGWPKILGGQDGVLLWPRGEANEAT